MGGGGGLMYGQGGTSTAIFTASGAMGVTVPAPTFSQTPGASQGPPAAVSGPPGDPYTHIPHIPAGTGQRGSLLGTGMAGVAGGMVVGGAGGWGVALRVGEQVVPLVAWRVQGQGMWCMWPFQQQQRLQRQREESS
ncbi:hypothetical protein CLOM_g10840 [Closterium sp. NIES-68]|nr:hypothetical protein CLOM_g10840 [Closterium sp. NIES-68]